MAISTPLRYPGGKSVMTSFFKDFIDSNNMTNVIYAEPYAGGAGAALNLLIENLVSRIIINDASISIYSFWDSVINHSNEFMELFDNTPINLEQWFVQKDIFRKDNLLPSVELGFATFFLNRCNRSGILGAGPIGGNTLEKQERANYKIDARFNKPVLRKKLLNIIELRDRIEVCNQDAMSFMGETINALSANEKTNTLVYLDPPYYVHGSELYLNFYIHEDHATLANYLENSTLIKWVLSYDNVPEIRDLYSNFHMYTFDLSYSVQAKRTGKELLINSRNSILPDAMEIKRASRAIPLIQV